MQFIGPVGFTEPLAFIGLAALPVIWLLLRALPPPARRIIFPAAILLKGLRDSEADAKTTPIWLRIARLAAIGAMIAGFSGPVLNPESQLAGSPSRPLLILLDGNWADAFDWSDRIEKAGEFLDSAARSGRPVALAKLTDRPRELIFKDAEDWAGTLSAMEPRPWEADETSVAEWLKSAFPGEFDTYWLTDGLNRGGRYELAAVLESKGELSVLERAEIVALRPPEFSDGGVALEAVRLGDDAAATFAVDAVGTDPAGAERVLATSEMEFLQGESTAAVRFSLMSEVRNRIAYFKIRGAYSAAAVSLSGDSLIRRKVALLGGRAEAEGQELLSPLHYLRRALESNSEIIEGSLDEVLNAAPDALVLSDTAQLTEFESLKLQAWVEAGGSLLRFAGPRMAASASDKTLEDRLLPVRLRAGGRIIGGAMSWGESRNLKAFEEGSPFFGLPIPDDIKITAQVLAQPEPELASKVLASLEDGTPIVTRKRVGSGSIYLFHVTANAEWSNLPLSGLFIDMLDRLAIMTRGNAQNRRDQIAKLPWMPERLLDGRGALRPVDYAKPVPGRLLIEEDASELAPPGIYRNEGKRVARNVFGRSKSLERARWPGGIDVVPLARGAETRLKGFLLALALALLAFDAAASLWLGGRFRGFPSSAAATAAAIAFGLALLPTVASSDDRKALWATAETVLAYLETGNPEIDDVSRAGLLGLSRQLSERTAVEPAEPVAIDPEIDELAFYPLIYWPIADGSSNGLTKNAFAKINVYLRSGGMILFDTRDAHLAGLETGSRRAGLIAELASELDIPRLEPLRGDHVLTRSFYLLSDFPGRLAGGRVWVEAAADNDPASVFSHSSVNDGVSPVVVGGNDWAAAWAIDSSGAELFPVGRGSGGERQREAAYRFGINLVMYALAGSYKSDQVHVLRLLKRQGS